MNNSAVPTKEEVTKEYKFSVRTTTGIFSVLSFFFFPWMVGIFYIFDYVTAYLHG